MSFRTRALLAMLAAALAPLALFAAGVRDEIAGRIAAEHLERVAVTSAMIERELAREANEIGERLAALAASMPGDDRLRLALSRSAGVDRRYLLEYAGRSMRLTGLDALQLHDMAGRILSSGQFRNDFDRLEPELQAGMSAGGDSVLLAWFRTAEGPMLALTRRETVRLGDAELVLVAGRRMDRRMLERFASGGDLFVALESTGSPGESHSAEAGARETGGLDIPILPAADARTAVPPTARLRIFQRGDPLADALRRIDRWFVAAVGLVAAAALALGVWLSVRLSRPLAELAETAGAISLAGSERIPGAARADEIGLIARRLTTMRRRLRSSAEALREAERRATVGEIARQVNHDIQNGLVPIRNVLRHLADVQERSPGELVSVFGERRHTLDASVGYLDALARRYARLAPRTESGPADLVAIAREAVSAAGADGARVRLVASEGVADVTADPVSLRRLLDNLVRNAVDSLTSGDGAVDVRITPARSAVRLIVADTGRGMSEAELTRAFEDFHTTKPNGTGLGLSIVRRLASDLGARLHVESAPGRGTTMTLDFPAVQAAVPPSQLRTKTRFPIHDSRFPRS
jgi:signal transduction histidine kinase